MISGGVVGGGEKYETFLLLLEKRKGCVCVCGIEKIGGGQLMKIRNVKQTGKSWFKRQREKEREKQVHNQRLRKKERIV